MEVLALEMADVVAREYGDIAFDAVAPVPMTAAEIQERGYNQSLLLAQSLSRLRHIPLWQPLVKQFETTPQKSLPALAVGMKLEGAVLLLVDDVVTTGSTMDECAKMLKIYGASAVYVVSATASRLSKDED